MSLLDVVYRGAYLGALTLAPALLAPEPRAATAMLGGLSLVALGLPVAATLWLRRAAQTLEATAAVALTSISALALVLVATRYDGADGPLLRGYYAAAPFVWAALASIAAALAGHFLGSSFKNKRVGAAVIVLAIGIFVFRSAHELIASPAAMWEATLANAPGNERAFASLYRSPAKLDRAAYARDTAACLAANPDACACLVAKSDAELLRGDAKAASADVLRARDAHCGLDESVSAGVSLREALALAMAKTARLDDAEQALGGSDESTKSTRLLMARAMVRQGRGDAAVAEQLARRVMTSDDPNPMRRDATLLVASLLMGRAANAEARPLLEKLLRDNPRDADAAYDLALIDDLAGNYNPAREGYLRALRENPEYRSARYNLAVLTLRQGIVQEARHHARKFAEAWPDDPRGPELIRLTGGN